MNQPERLKNAKRGVRHPRKMPSLPESVVKIRAFAVERIMDAVRRRQKSKIALFDGVYRKAKPLSSAVKAKCLECGGLTVEEVRDCRVYYCPLWLYRPFQRKAKEGVE